MHDLIWKNIRLAVVSDFDSQAIQITNFICRPCGSSGAVCTVTLHMVSLVLSLVRGWITVTLWTMVCQTPISKDYRGRKTPLHDLFANLLDVNITQSTSKRTSVGNMCVAELTTRLLSSATRSPTSYLLSTQFSSTNIAIRRFSCCAPPFGTVFPPTHRGS